VAGVRAGHRAGLPAGAGSSPRRRPAPVAAAVLVLLALAAVLLAAGCGAAPGHGKAAPAAPAGSPPGARTAGSDGSASGSGGGSGDAAGGGAASGNAAGGGATGKAADPVRLRLPDVAVAAPVVPLGLDAAGRLIPPAGFAEVGWNRAGPEPGDDGVAVIAGHVDSKTGPAVFYRLGRLRPGAVVFVDRADGTTATFVVDRLAEFAKADFPDEEVYHSGTGAQLRLITCAGSFDHGTGHYVDNIVVFAHLS